MKTPENVDTLGHSELVELVKQLLARVAALEAENAELKQRLNQNSRNSSLPPSSDKALGQLKKRPKPKRPKGPPLGHDGVTRFGFGEPDTTLGHTPDVCACGESLADEPDEATEAFQVAELEKPVVVTEHRRTSRRCRTCGKLNVAPWPETVIPGQSYGPRLQAWLVYLHTLHNQSYQKLETLCEDLLGVPMSQGSLQRLLENASEALAPSMDTLQERVRMAKGLHCDETRWRCNGQSKYLWCAVTDTFSYFWIHASRSRQALFAGIGDAFQGVCHSDFYAVYTPMAGQGCCAHLLRDIEACCESPQAREEAFGLQLGLWLTDLWDLWREQAAGTLAEADYLLRAAEVRDQLLVWLEGFEDLPKRAARLRKRILTQRDRVFYFVTHPDTPPDNNAAERALRGLVTNRKVTGGNRTATGEQMKTRLFSIAQTCVKQGLNTVEYIRNALMATAHPHFDYPTLFNSG